MRRFDADLTLIHIQSTILWTARELHFHRLTPFLFKLILDRNKNKNPYSKKKAVQD